VADLDCDNTETYLEISWFYLFVKLLLLLLGPNVYKVFIQQYD